MEKTIRELGLPGLYELMPRRHSDRRGYFFELHRDGDAAGLMAGRFVQDNISLSARGVLRGLHFQRTKPQAKLVSVLAGSAFDVVVDLRPDSPSFGRWAFVVLSAELGNQLYVPAGFAHGFYALEDGTVCHYKCSEYYNGRDEGGIRWDDPELAIAWPGSPTIISPKDAALPFFKEFL